jgi:hypothetical protein
MRKLILSSLLPASFLLQAKAQDPAAIFNRHRDSIPAEHIHLHFNKQAYVAGETIWFKAYTYAAGMAQPVSTNLFAELLNERGDIIQSKRLPVLSGQSTYGQFELPAGSPQGVYFVRAWTNYTRHFDQSYVFKKGIPVFNPGTAASSAIQNRTGYSFEWFPEGGKLVSGVDNVIAFRCLDKQLQPVKANGALLDSKGTSLGTFATNKYGLGYFSITPAKGEKYYGEVQLPDNSKQKFELPAAADNAVVLSVVDHELGKIFTILTPPGNANNPKEVTLLAVMNNNIVLNTKVELKENQAQALVSNEKLNEGIIRLMVFDAGNNLLAQRAAYISTENSKVPVELKTADKGTTLKAINNWSFVLPEGIEGQFSVSVTDADKELVSKNEDNIFSSLLWQGGSANYLAGTQVKDDEVKDMILLTGSRFDDNWDVFAKMKRPDINDELHLPLKGKLFEQGNNKLITQGQLNLLVKTKDSVGKEYNVPVMKDGSFKLYELVFEDTARIYYRWKGAKNENPIPTEMELDKTNHDYSSLLRNIPAETYIILKKPLLQDANALALAPKLIENVKNEMKSVSGLSVKTNIPASEKNTGNAKDVNKRYTSGAFSSMGNTRMIDLLTNPPNNQSGNIFDYITGQIGGLTVVKSGGSYTLRTVRGTSTLEVIRGNSSGQVAAKVFLNESEVTTDVIARISVDQIALVKFFPTGAISLPGIGLSAVFCAYTKKVEDMGATDNRYFNSIVFPGYDAAKKIPQPDYTIDDKKKPDNRTTLYWNPDITLEAGNREIKISFYNSDTTKRFHVVLEGITSDGRLVSFEKVVE